MLRQDLLTGAQLKLASCWVQFVDYQYNANIPFCILDPFLLPIQQVDKGAIKFVLSGANIMCPGLTSPGAKLNPAEANEIVVAFI